MSADTQRIRPIAVCVFRHGDRILVSDGYDATKRSAFCRPLGGGIEFGEPSAVALAREIREELGVDIREPRLLGVLENLFNLDGQPGHEIIFVYDARFANESLYDRAEIPFHETGWSSGNARWFDLSRAAEDKARLVPEGLVRLLNG